LVVPTPSNFYKTISNGVIERVLKAIEPLEACLLKMTWRSVVMNSFNILNPAKLRHAALCDCLKTGACVTRADRARHASDDTEREREMGGLGQVARFDWLGEILIIFIFWTQLFHWKNYFLFFIFLPKFVIFFPL
jgi:hypothetical protein